MKLNLSPEDDKLTLDVARNKARETLWKRGEFLDIVLDKTQKEMVSNYKDDESIFYVWLCSRRIGKSVGLIGTSFEEAIKKPGSRILYLSKTTDNVREIVDQASTVVLATCPNHLKPHFNKNENKFVFQNGSEIRIKGLDQSGADTIRGVKGSLIILDEFCFMKNLNYTLDSILMPMCIAEGGRILMASSAPDSPGHESLGWIKKAQERGAITVKTIYDCPRWSEKQLQLFIEEAGGEDSSTFKREYLAEIVVERDRAILPSFTEEKAQQIVTPRSMPDYYIPDTYVSLDIGFRDLSVALFAWWDYENAKLVIQDEVVLKGNEATTDNIARRIVQKEQELWPGAVPHKRVCDTDPRLIEDLRKISNLNFRPTKKDNKEAQINQTNIMVGNNSIIIDPKCKTLISHCKYGIWNTNRTSFARTATLGHCDALDALLYMVRNIDRHRNPFVEPTAGPDQVYHGAAPRTAASKAVSVVQKLFKR